LIDGLTTRALDRGEFVFRQGDEGEEFFILEDGELECLAHDNERVRVLGAGAHFGEIAILKNVPRTLSVRVVS
jgi:cAMP-dependent protein kinase regulator